MSRRALSLAASLGVAVVASSLGCASANRGANAVVAGAVATNVGSGRTCTTTSELGGWREEDGLLFGTCEDFLSDFAGWLDRSCKKAAPELVAAFAATVDATPGTPATNPYDPRTRDRRAKIFLDAARGRVPAGCADGFPAARDEEDFSRDVFEVKRDWRRCAPDEDLFRSFTVDRGDRLEYGGAQIMVGAYFWALAMKPHLSPVGRQYLHKFLACEVVASEGMLDHDAEARRRLDTVHTDDP